ncbi:MAG: GTP-binding protein [Blautia caecimuris]
MEQDRAWSQLLQPLQPALDSEERSRNRALEHRINIIDTPGHVDLTAEVRAFSSCTGRRCRRFCAKGGVEPQSENVWRQADTYNVRVWHSSTRWTSLALIYNMIDQTRLGKNLSAFSPIGKEDEFKIIVCSR